MANTEQQALDTQALTGTRNGPYRSFNPVSRTQIWQWCSAMGDTNPLYLDTAYQQSVGITRAVAPPAMMQMWTMRDVNMALAPGSSDTPPYAVFDALSARGYAANVAVSYDIQFHRLLQEGDRAHHFTTIASISELKRTAIGEGYFVVEHAEYLDQHDRLYAEADITYFQYRPVTRTADVDASQSTRDATTSAKGPAGAHNQHAKLRYADIRVAQALPELRIPITHKLIVSGAIATQDFIDVHHNAPAAKAAGMPDIFMNILTTCGLTARYLTDWAGPDARLHRLTFRLQAPNTPGDSMRLRGQVTAVEPDAREGQGAVDVAFSGENALGTHVAGSATLSLG